MPESAGGAYCSCLPHFLFAYYFVLSVFFANLLARFFAFHTGPCQKGTQSDDQPG